MAEKSALVVANFSGSRRWDLAKTGGPGRVRRWLQTGWQGGEAVNPLDKRTLGKSMSRLETHWGVERRAARRDEESVEEEFF